MRYALCVMRYALRVMHPRITQISRIIQKELAATEQNNLSTCAATANCQLTTHNSPHLIERGFKGFNGFTRILVEVKRYASTNYTNFTNYSKRIGCNRAKQSIHLRSNCQLPTANSHLSVSPSLRSQLSAHNSPLTTLRSQLSAHNSPLSAQNSPLTTHRSQLSAHRSPLPLKLPLLYALSLIIAVFSFS